MRQRPGAPRLHRLVSQLGRLLGCPHKRPFHPPGEFNRHKTTSRIEIILSAFVDHSEIVILGGLLVAQDGVNLVKFERDWIIGVVDTDHKARPHWFSSLHRLSLSNASTGSLFCSAYTLGFVPVQFRPSNCRAVGLCCAIVP